MGATFPYAIALPPGAGPPWVPPQPLPGPGPTCLYITVSRTYLGAQNPIGLQHLSCGWPNPINLIGYKSNSYQFMSGGNDGHSRQGDREAKQAAVDRALDQAFTNRISRAFDSLCDTAQEEHAVQRFVDRFKTATDMWNAVSSAVQEEYPKGFVAPVED